MLSSAPETDVEGVAEVVWTDAVAAEEKFEKIFVDERVAADIKSLQSLL